MSNFLKLLASYDTVTTQARSTTSRNADPVIRNRENFITQAERQRDALLNNKPPKKNDWWKKLEDGKVTVCLRIGTATVNFGVGTHVTVGDVPEAVMIFDQAIEAANDGDIDQMLAASKVIKKKGGKQ